MENEFIKQTEHHIYPRHWIDNNGTNNMINRIMLPETVHSNWHRVFWNMEFHHQVSRVLQMNKQILQKHVVREVYKIMNDDPTYIYEKWVYRPKP